jgi:hypothetical protein
MTNTPDPTLKIWTGRHVELELRYSDGETERLALDVVADAAADFDRGFLGESTALAKAILGRQAGETAEYQAGDRVRVRILAVYPEWKGQPADLSARRDEALRKAVRDSEDTSAILFASSFSGKWGDYDPNAVPRQKEEDGDEDDQETKAK